VQLYAGAFFPGLMLASLYVAYVILIAWLKPQWAPPLSQAERVVPLPPLSQRLADSPAAHAVVGLLKGRRNAGVPFSHVLKQLGIVAMPGVVFVLLACFSYKAATTVEAQARYDIEEIGAARSAPSEGGLQEPPGEGGLAEPPREGGLQEPPADPAEPAEPAPATSTPPLAEPPTAAAASVESAESVASVATPSPAEASADTAAGTTTAGPTERPAPTWWWVVFAVCGAMVALFYLFLSFARLEIFKMLLASFFPLVLLIMSVLGSIVLGLATPTEAAAMGALGGMLLAAAYRRLNLAVLKESVFLTAKTSAMVCWLFVGSAIFSAAFALLGGQALVEEWVLGMNLTKVEFLILSQVIIFLLGWPLEWTEIIVIFMPIFIPLLDNFGVDPLFFGLLVALNLQTAFLSPPVAMAAFYLKGVSPPHVTLNQIFLGMLPFMGIQVLAIVLLYVWPQIGLWLPQLLYK
jgi:TRAP-type mannitol/chloroaromatic compound transport system permease large subunit